MNNSIEQLPINTEIPGNPSPAEGEDQPADVPKDTTKPLLEQDEFKFCSLESVVETIRKNYGYGPYKNDPILMTVTIMQVFTEALDKLLKRHENASLVIFAKETGNLIGHEHEVSQEIINGMGKITGDFSKMITAQSTKVIKDAFTAHSEAMDKLDKTLEKTRINAMYCAGITLVAVVAAVAAVMALKLFMGR